MAVNVGTLVLKLVGDITGLNKTFADVGKIAAGVGIGNLVSGAITSGLGKMVDLAADLSGHFREAALYVAKMGSEFEASQVAFETLTGSTPIGKKLFQDVLGVAAESPFTAQDTIGAAKTLLGYGVAAKDVVSVLKQIGDIAAGTGAHLHNIALAYGQVVSKGRLMAEELTRQLGNTGLGAADIAAALGMTQAKFMQMMEAGLVSSDMFREAIKNLTSEGGRFANSQDRLLQTVKGRWNQLVETVQLFAGNFGAAIFEKFPVAKYLEKIVGSIGTIDVQGILGRVERFADAIAPALKAIGEFGLGVVYAAQAFIGNLMPAVSDGSQSIAGFVSGLGKPLIEFMKLVVELGSLFTKIAIDIGGALFKYVVGPLMWATTMITRAEYSSIAKGFDKGGDFANNIYEAARKTNLNQAFGEASRDLNGFLGGITGRGGVPPVSRAQEEAMRAQQERLQADKDFIAAMESMMPGFKAGMDKMGKAFSDPQSGMSQFAKFLQDAEFIQGARARADLFGGDAALNKMLLASWQSAAGGLGSLPEAIAPAARFGSQEAARIINGAISQINAPVQEDMIRQNWDRLQEKMERANALSERQLAELEKLSQEKFGGAMIGGR